MPMLLSWPQEPATRSPCKISTATGSTFKCGRAGVCGQASISNSKRQLGLARASKRKNFATHFPTVTIICSAGRHKLHESLSSLTFQKMKSSGSTYQPRDL